MKQALPFSAPFDLGALSEPRDETISPPADSLRRIAEWAGLDALSFLRADLCLSRVGEDAYAVVGRLHADVVQSCVVTLEPVASHLEREFTRRYQVTRKKRSQTPPTEEAEPDADGEVETVTHPLVDLAAPILEELSLAIDPYPRAAGAVFALPGEDRGASQNPFAVLEQLKIKGGKPGKS
jgi:uncharacterized metal-binding protein YceD (DUF177 family)